MTPRHLADAALIALIDGSPDSLRSSTSHLQECLTCRRRRDELILQSDALTRLFAAEDEENWWRWVEFFGRTREANGRRKGLIEVTL